MISFVICHKDKLKLDSLTESLKQTVKSTCELIIYDNQQNLSISKVYNDCVYRAIYEYIFFVHEDMEFLSQGWDIAVLHALNMPDTGVVGFAGSKVLTEIPSYWHRYGKDIVNEANANNGDEVVVVDGFFMACKKALVQQVPFDETLSRFHSYDIDLCLAALHNGYKNRIAAPVKFIHHSYGSYNKDWVEGTLRVFEKYKNTLPIAIDNTTHSAAYMKVCFVFFIQKIAYLSDVGIEGKLKYSFATLKFYPNKAKAWVLLCYIYSSIVYKHLRKLSNRP